MYVVPSDSLEHYGILGMKWGVRRTPEELGHRKAQKAIKAQGTLEKYKAKKLRRIDKMYEKAISKTEDALDYDPSNKKLKKQLRGLKELKKKDILKVDAMSYTDVMDEIKSIRQARINKAAKIAGTTAKAAGATALWGARMALTGVRIYGTFKAAEIIGEMGMHAIDWLQSPEGQAMVNKGINTVGAFVTFGDTVAKVTNPDIAQYVDSKALADMAFDYGEDYIRKSLAR